MPIKLIECESHNGLSQMVSCAVEDFADDSQIAHVIDEFCAVLAKDRGAKQRWRREDDCCWEVTGGMLRKNGGKRVLDRAEKALRSLGFDEIERKTVSKAALRRE